MIAKGSPVAVLGAGAWGTTLARMLAGEGYSVRLWARRPEFAQQLEAERENRQYLPGAAFPEKLRAVAELAEALADAPAVVVAVPSIGLREAAALAAQHLQTGALVICATKGLERPKG
ncbi:MAG: 2-dehydropantoate 2-reductase N-terminal domain-containing protein, partial [Armatimonadota bacterium]